MNFFFQAEDGIRDWSVTGVQTCALRSLGYIRNNSKKFKVFVANRIQQIQEGSKVEQWKYVPTKLNPADFASRGLVHTDSDRKAAIWFDGPEFLWHTEENWPADNNQEGISDTDPEVKYSLQVNLVLTCNSSLDILEKKSTWKKIRKVIAVMMKFKEKITKAVSQSNDPKQMINLNMIQKSETTTIKVVQRRHF